MEYLSRMLHNLKDHPQFRHHPSCASLNITHLTFTYDLLFFAKGNLNSVRTILDKFELFSNTSGLIANRRKNDIYFAGVSESKRREIVACAQFQGFNGFMPFIWKAMI